jgi:hypothetical protein
MEKPEPPRLVGHAEVRRMVDDLNALMVIAPDPIVTPDKVREMLQADEIHRQDNEFHLELGRFGRGEED